MFPLYQCEWINLLSEADKIRRYSALGGSELANRKYATKFQIDVTGYLLTTLRTVVKDAPTTNTTTKDSGTQNM